MKMNLKEMKTLYTFGCPNREATVERLRYVAALTPDPAAKKLFYMLSVKLSDEKCDKWYRCFYYNLRLHLCLTLLEHLYYRRCQLPRSARV